ncbi:MAG: TetR/AcrR family transcriptional regulator [Anaerolineae bacterium]
MSNQSTGKSNRRQQILEAAMNCFARKGYHVTTMDDISAELPFSKGLIYYYFDSKRDIFLAILENWKEAYLKGWEMLQSADDDATIQIHKCLEYGMYLVTSSAEIARVEFEFYSELGRDTAVSTAFRDLFTEIRNQIKNILEAGISSGQLRPMDTDALAAVLFAVYEGLAIQASVEPDGFNWPAISKNLVELVMRGISATEKE